MKKRIRFIALTAFFLLGQAFWSMPASLAAETEGFNLQAMLEPNPVMRSQRVNLYAALYTLRGADVTVVVDAVRPEIEATLSEAVDEMRRGLGSYGIPSSITPVKLPTWFSSAGNMRRSGYSYYEVGSPVRVKWKQFLSPAGFQDTTVLIGPDGILYVGGMDGKVYAIRSSDGGVLWSVDTGGAIQTPGTIGPDGTLYFGNRAGKATAISPDGRIKWVRNLGGSIESAPAIDQTGRTYWAGGSRYWCFDAEGNEVWSMASPIPGSVFGDPSVAPDGTVYFSGQRGVAAISRDGVLRWFYQYETYYGFQSPIALDPVNGNVYVGNPLGEIVALGMYDGREKWRYRVRPGTNVVSPSLSPDGRVFTVDWTFQGLVVLGSNGNVLNRISLGTAARGEITVTPGGNVLLTTEDGRLLAVSTSSGSILWQVQLGVNSENQPSIDRNGVVYAVTENGWLWAIETGMSGQTRNFSNLFWEGILVNYARNSWTEGRYPVVVLVTSAPWDDFSDERKNFLENLRMSGAVLYVVGDLSPNAIAQATSLVDNPNNVFSVTGSLVEAFRKIATDLARGAASQSSDYRVQADEAWAELPDGFRIPLQWDTVLRRYQGEFLVPDGGSPGTWPGNGTYTVKVKARKDGVLKEVPLTLIVQGNIKEKIYIRQIQF
ncbi:MAG: cell surface protein [Hydrogenibacillus schlegelii]|uniref:Cell surface protein n=1 Tax=Hydrogenibacillus schlegelii TaxID=1484 RepID=A0A2T5G5X4_HYDSH|nr:PQQ-binding-like beta-propeller repeat protein [Hydrogenibacillus schlegelii]PTQ51584.1 MAG: cell surface protein [Hydrogenibacillus schlegelii]